MTKTDPIAVRDRILEQALPDVPFDGWDWTLIEKATGKAGYEKDMARAVFPDRIPDVLDHFADWADRRMLKALEGSNPEDMRVRDRIRAGVTARLSLLRPHREAVREAVQHWAIPFRQIHAGRAVWRTADRIWTWAGDTATDYNHYTKRALLSGILTSTTVVWLKDTDENSGKTLAFLDRRIDNVLTIGGVIGKVMRRWRGEAA